jgi:hypothetical protein
MYKLWTSWLRNFLKPIIISSFFDPNILLDTTFSNNFKGRRGGNWSLKYCPIYVVTIDVIWVGNRIYWILTDRNYI